MLRTKFFNVISFLILLGFILISLNFVWSKGICCGDDAYHAVIAKNLANGLGYASTIQAYYWHYTLMPFDPLVGSGPTIILPAALAIKIFGNTYWAPGLANVILWSILLVSIGFFVHKLNHGFRFILFTTAFLFLTYSFMVYHFEQWYSLLGEVPAALFVLSGTLCFFHRDSKLNRIMTGVLFSFAVLAKLLSLVAFVVFISILLLMYIVEHLKKQEYAWNDLASRIFHLCVGFLTPFVIFEIWKLIDLGPYNFLKYWYDYLKYVISFGAKSGQALSLIALYNERLTTLYNRFGLLISNVGIILFLAWSMIKKDKTLSYLFIVLVGIVVGYSFWWLFISIGWARYFIICLIILIFVISLPLLSQHPRINTFVYFLLVILLSSNNWIRLKYPYEELNGKYFSPTNQTLALLETSQFLSAELKNSDNSIATQMWATAVDLEYIMKSSLNFTTYHDDILLDDDSFILAVNSKFMSNDDKEFNDLLTNCGSIWEKGTYLVKECHSSVKDVK